MKRIFKFTGLFLLMILLTACKPQAPVDTDTPKTAQEAEITTIKISGKNFKFIIDGKENPDIRIKLGEKVRVEFASEEGFHDWVVDELKAATKQISAGQSDFIEFTPNQTGEFFYYCSVMKHRANGMEGKLIVE